MFRLFKHYVPHAVIGLWLVELATLLLAAEAGWRLYAHQIGMGVGALDDRWLPLVTFSVTLQLGMMATGFYGNEALRSMKFGVARLLTGVSLGVIFLALVRFVFPEWTLWRANSIYAMAVAIAALFGIRFLLMLFVGTDTFRRRIVVLGAGRRAARIGELAARPGGGFTVAGYIAMTDAPTVVAGAVRRGDIENLSEYVTSLGAGEVVLALEERRNALPLADLLRIKTTGVHVNDMASFLERETGRVDLATTNPSVLIFSDGFSAGQRVARVSKRVFDIFASLAVLILSLPLVMIAAIAVKLDSRGPMLYRQPRVGLYGEPYDIWKLRSMRTDAEAAGQAVWAEENDPRITRVGRVIRKLRIDELPQCWCVLKGAMSFVGPRPERPSFVADLEQQMPFYAERHMVKPGLTGWAQINYPYGASVEDARVKLEYDLYYAKNYSPFLDLLILLQTVRVVLWPAGGALMGDWLVQLSSIFAGLAMLAFGGAALWLILRPSQRMAALMPSRVALVALVAGVGLWSGVWYLFGPGSSAIMVADTLRNLVFLAWLGASFRVEGSGLRARSIRFVLLTLVMINLIPAILGGLALLDIALADVPVGTAWLKPGLRLVDMLTASGGLLLVENFARHRSDGLRAPVLLVAGGIAALWAYTLNIHLLGWLSGSTPATLVLLEPLVALLVLPTFLLVAMDMGRERIRLSRTIAFRTLAIVALALYLMVIALTGALARLMGGDYGQLAQGVFLILALGVGGLLFASPRARAWLSVMIAKHFFEHRYDYRAEWMRFTATLEGQAQGSEPTFRRIARALAELAGSPAAVLLTADSDGNYRVIDHWQWPTALDADNQLSVRDAFALQETGHIVDIDRLRSSAADGPADERPSFELPAWLTADERAWVLLPLLHAGRMAGIAVLHRPARGALDWEDLDVLRISGRQAASHIAEMQSQAELSEARRFDEFNRRFAFIMHDVKNLASQLGLLAANAERHAENPEFRADMIETLKLSVARMNELLLRLSPQGRSGAVGRGTVKVAPVLNRIAAEAGRRHPVSTGCDDGLDVAGDQDAIIQILGHLVANAIDASEGDAPVLLAASADGDGVRIDVVDHGCGMSREFIRGGLFKPFVSTKDNGFGLGAFEALQLARAMNGRLDVDSREGEGTRFSLWLPRAAQQELGEREERVA